MALSDLQLKKVINKIWREGHDAGFDQGLKQGHSTLTVGWFFGVWLFSCIISGFAGLIIARVFDQFLLVQ